MYANIPLAYCFKRSSQAGVTRALSSHVPGELLHVVILLYVEVLLSISSTYQGHLCSIKSYPPRFHSFKCCPIRFRLIRHQVYLLSQYRIYVLPSESSNPKCLSKASSAHIALSSNHSPPQLHTQCRNRCYLAEL